MRKPVNEKRVLELINKYELTNQQIAVRMGISAQTAGRVRRENKK